MPEPIGPEAVLEKKRRFLLPCLHHFYRRPPQIVRGAGLWLEDHEGRRYLDGFAGVSVLAVGHSHPRVVEAVRRQVGELAHTTTIYLTQPMVDLAERLAEWLPDPLGRSFFCASGSEANEGAVLAAQLATGRRELLALDRGLHGRTKLGMSLTGLGMWRADDTPVGGVHHVPTPYCHRCPLRLSHPSCGLACADEIHEVIRFRTAGQVAAMIVEPVLGNGGIIVPPEGWLERVREILDLHGILLIADEVQTGFGRTGRRFGFQHSAVVPDVVTVAKALGGGLPIAAFVATDAVADAFDRPSASTFGGNLVSCAAAHAVLDVIEEEGLIERSARVGAHFRERLDSLATRFPVLGDVRGLGLMLGAEIVDSDGRPDPERLDDLLESLKDSGILAGKTGADRNVLTFQPPLLFGEEEVDLVVRTLESCLSGLPNHDARR